MSDTAPEVAERKALAVQLERALLAARRAARLSDDPGSLPALTALARDVRSIDPDVLRAGWGPAWRSFADVALVSQGRDPVDPSCFVWAPLPAVDAYLDVAADSAEPSWWDGRSQEETLYLLARTSPGQLSDDDLAALGWWDEVHRRRLACGLPYQAGEADGSELYQLIDAAISGDVSVLERLAELLPEHNAAALRQVRAGAASGVWPSGLADDRGLWLLMLRLWAPGEVIQPARSAFHRWAAFRRAYDLTLTRDYAAAWSQISAFPPHSRPEIRLLKEVENLRAYLTLVRSPQTVAMQQATTILQVVHGSPMAKANQEMIRRRSQLTTNERGTCENPYLALGVDHGSPHEEWIPAWRRARAENAGNINELSRVNDARDTIMALERDGMDGKRQIFIVPLKAASLTPHVERPPGCLVPGPRAHPNKTSHLLDFAVQRLRAEAIRELTGVASPAAAANGG